MVKCLEKLYNDVHVELKSCRKILFFIKMSITGDRVARGKYRKNLSDYCHYTYMHSYPAYFRQKNHGRIAVYTVVFGSYDRLKPVGFKSKYCDYYIITDQKVDKSLGWKKLDYKFDESMGVLTNAEKNRFCKIHPEVLFPQYEYSIYLDGSIEPRYDIYPLIGRMEEKFIGMFQHNVRNCIYEEGKTCIRVGKAKQEDVDLLFSKYRAEGFPKNFGLTECGIMIRKHNDPQCVKVMNDWWYSYMNGPRRDQLSFMYCLWKNGYSKDDVAILGADYVSEPRFASEGHC